MNFLTTTLIWFGFITPPDTYNTYEYYEDAFKQIYLSMWEGTGYDDRFTIKAKCFYRAMTCLYDSNMVDLLDRRSLMYSYLSKLYKTDSVNDTLNRYKKILENGSSIKRLMKLKCKSYDKGTTRKFTEDETLNNDLISLYNESNIDNQLRDAYLKAKLTGIVAILPKVNNDKVELIVLTPDNFNYKYENNELVEFIYPINTNKEIQFIEWTKATRKKFKTTKNRREYIEEMDNPYSTIPVVFLKFDGTMSQSCENQLKVNKFAFQTEQDVDFNTSPFKLGINIEKSKITNALDELIVVTNVKDSSFDGTVEPRIDISNTSPNYIALDEFVIERKIRMFEDEGIPRSLLLRETELSGFAIFMSQLELYEQMFEDETTLIQFEKDLLNLIVLILNTDTNETTTVNYNLNANDLKLQIYYPMDSITLTPTEEYTQDTQKVKDMQLGKKDFLIKWGGLDSNATIEQAIAFLEQRKLENEKLDFSVGGSNEQVQPQTQTQTLPIAAQDANTIVQEPIQNDTNTQVQNGSN